MQHVLIVLQPHNSLSHDENTNHGGIERVVEAEVTELLRRNIRTTVISARNHSSISGVRWRDPLAGIEAHAKDLRKPRGMAAYASGVSDAVREASSGRVPADVIHIHQDPLLAARLSSESPLPVVVTLHDTGSGLNERAYRDATGAYFVALSAWQMGTYPASMPIVGVVPSGLVPKRDFAAIKRPFTCSIGRIIPRKGVEEAIHASRLAGIDLVLAGPIDDADYFRNRVEPYITHSILAPRARASFIRSLANWTGDDGKCVVYLGPVSGRERDLILRSAQANLFLIHGDEAFGLIPIEAAMLGTPTIATPVSAPAETLEEGVTALFAETVEEAAAQIRGIERLDARRCRAAVVERFSAATMVDAYLEVFDRARTMKDRLRVPEVEFTPSAVGRAMWSQN